MKKTKNIPLLLLILLLTFNIGAQNSPSFYPFKGFHVGLTGQAEYVNKCSFVALTGADPAPKARWTTGWEAGIEFSYHFAKYFGISAGINYGTILSYKRDIYESIVPDGYGGWKDVYEYEPTLIIKRSNEILFPVKLEFHYPLCKNLFFMSETGIKIKGVLQRLNYGKDGIGIYATDYSFILDPLYSSRNTPKEIIYYEDFGIRRMGKIYCDLLFGIGLYYQLPYGDLLRFAAGANISFNNIIEGYYQYFLTNSYGTFSVKNDFIYTQLSYIHTLNWQKARKYLKKQEYSFSSKKERRKKVMELLNAK